MTVTRGLIGVPGNCPHMRHNGVAWRQLFGRSSPTLVLTGTSIGRLVRRCLPFRHGPDSRDSTRPAWLHLYNWSTLTATPTPVGLRYDVVDSPAVTFAGFESHTTTLNPGVSTGLLTDPADEVIIVKSGLVVFSVSAPHAR